MDQESVRRSVQEFYLLVADGSEHMHIFSSELLPLARGSSVDHGRALLAAKRRLEHSFVELVGLFEELEAAASPNQEELQFRNYADRESERK